MTNIPVAHAMPAAADYAAIAQNVLLLEASALQRAASIVGPPIKLAVDVILQGSGKIVTSGVGKSGHVAQKVAATLSSTGTTAVFIHPTDAIHGDLGMYRDGDVTLMFSKSGSTEELMRLVPVLKTMKSPVIAVLGNPSSPLAAIADVVLDGSVEREADPLNVAPTASTTLGLAIGDCLAVALMHARGFGLADFVRTHPGGALGRSLCLTVADVMQPLARVAKARVGARMREVVVAMNERPLGAVLLVGPDGFLHGIVTDGDLRRALVVCDNLNEAVVDTFMTANPVTIAATAPIRNALTLMEERKSQLSVLPVINENSRCVGLLRLHDLYQPQLA